MLHCRKAEVKVKPKFLRSTQPSHTDRFVLYQKQTTRQMLTVINPRKARQRCKLKPGRYSEAWGMLSKYPKQSDLLKQDLFKVQSLKFSFLMKPKVIHFRHACCMTCLLYVVWISFQKGEMNCEMDSHDGCAAVWTY